MPLGHTSKTFYFNIQVSSVFCRDNQPTNYQYRAEKLIRSVS